jgi:DNA sulfur modification protein DndD
LRAARQAAQSESEQELERFILSLRGRAVDTGHCETCNQDLPPNVRSRLKKSLAPKAHPHGNGRANNPTHANPAEDPRTRLAAAMARIGTLNKFSETDNAGEVRHLWQRIGELRLERVSLQDRLGDLENDLSTANADDIRRTQISYRGIVEKITIARTGIEAAEQTIAEKIANIERLKAALATSGGSNLKATQRRAAILQDSADVFAAAIERYKANLRARVEKTASKLFRSMTTEKDDYTGLTINSNYGLTIRHRDGGAEHHRSAGAEHVVALALMGALQKNAPLRGPIVMDSPFGRLDGGHTSNVIQTLPDVAEQVVLLVYKSEVDKTRMRELLGSALVREYELHRVDSRQTRIRLAK